MKAVKQGILSAALALTSMSAIAGPFYIGQAADFNAYIMEDMQGTHSDVEGRLAVGGNLTLDNYGLGLQLNNQGSKPVLVGGGDAKMRDSRVYNGDAVAAGTIDVDETVGLYNDPDTHNTNAFYQDDSFDFAATNAEVLFKSSLWGAYSANAQVELGINDANELWGLNFSGTNDVNVFSIDAQTLSSPNKKITIDIPDTSYAIINVMGEAVELFNTGFHLPDDQKFPDNDSNGEQEDRHAGLYNERVLFNFVDATSLVMNGIGFKGSILAPLADVTFSDGHIDGNLIVKSLRSADNENTGQINNYGFAGFTSVNEPATGLILAFAALFLVRRSKRVS